MQNNFFRGLILFVVPLFVLATSIATGLAQQQQSPTTIQEPESTQEPDSSQLVQEFTEMLDQHAVDPVDFIINKFATSDIILLGEVHQVKENCEFVASLIEPLNEKGVKRLCSEFTPSRFNGKLREILTASEYDEEAVKNLFRKGPWPNWGHMEYMKIIEKAWQVNQNLEDDERPFLVVGIDSDWSQVKRMGMNRQQKFEMLVERERHMLENIEHASDGMSEKVLVHIGFAHTVPHGIRVGNELKKKYDENVYQVMLHHALATRSGVSEITRIIEASVADADVEQVGFESSRTPIADLKDQSIPYVKRFSQLAQGYIFLKPADKLQPTTWVDGFINQDNFKDALFLAKEFGLTKQNVPQTPAELDELWAKVFSSR